jgi:uncharacterized protein (TIGR03083 family)
MTSLPVIDPCALIAADSAALADAAVGNVSAPAEHCPGWTVADLVRHVWDVHSFWGQLVERRLDDPDGYQAPTEPSDDEVIDAFRAGAQRLVQILDTADPTTPVWTWASQKDAGFVIRHQVQEAAVHRWDAEHAAGRDFAIDRDGAADSIEEFLTFSLSKRAKDAEPLDVPVTLTATDAAFSWTLTPGDDHRLAWTRDGETAATEVRGTASDILLFLYRRRSLAELDVVGDSMRASQIAGYTATD